MLRAHGSMVPAGTYEAVLFRAGTRGPSDCPSYLWEFKVLSGEHVGNVFGTLTEGFPEKGNSLHWFLTQITEVRSARRLRALAKTPWKLLGGTYEVVFAPPVRGLNE